MSCFGLATLTTTAPAPASCAGARDRRVGALHRLDRDDGARPSRRSSGRCRGRRWRRPCGSRTPGRPPRRASGARRGQHAGRGQQRLQERGRVEQLDALAPACTSATAAISASVFCAVSRRSTREQRQVGHEVREDLHVLDLAGHHRLGDRRRPCSTEMHLAELAERHPVQRGAARLGARRSSAGAASSLMATTVTRGPGACAASRTRNGKRPLPAMRPSGSAARSRPATRPRRPRRRRAGSVRRSMTPRVERADEVDEYRPRRTRAPDRARSRPARGVVFSLDVEQVAVGAASAWRSRRPGSRGAPGRRCSGRSCGPGGCRPSWRTAARPW